MLTVRSRFTAGFAAVMALMFSLLAVPSAIADEVNTVSVIGVVTDSHGDPAIGVVVTLNTCTDGMFGGLECDLALNQTSTDINGEFAFTNLSPERYRVGFIADDNVHAPVYWTEDGAGADSVEAAGEILWDESKTVHEIDMQLYEGAVFGGIVKDASGNPVDGVGIEVTAVDSGDSLGSWESGEDGDFRLGGLIAGQYSFEFTHGTSTSSVTLTFSKGEQLLNQNIVLGLPAIMNVGKPSISGDAVVGETLTANEGVWSQSGVTESYQWFADDEVIPGATSASFLVPGSVLEKQITVSAVASKAGYSSSDAVLSDPTDPISVPQLDSIVLPTLSGEFKVGQTLTVDPGTWDPAHSSFAYFWDMDGMILVDSAGPTLTLTADHVGKEICVEVRPTFDGASDYGQMVGDCGVVAPGTLTSVLRPSIVGTPEVGKTLTARPGSFGLSGVSVTYRWYADGRAISGATKSTYRLPTAALNKRITVGIVATKPGYSTTSEIRSASTAKVGYTSSLSVKTKNKKKRKIDFSVTVKANKKAVRGKVRVYRGTKLVKTVNLNKKGKATIKLTKQPAGRHKYTIKYVGSGTARPVSKAIWITTRK